MMPAAIKNTETQKSDDGWAIVTDSGWFMLQEPLLKPINNNDYFDIHFRNMQWMQKQALITIPDGKRLRVLTAMGLTGMQRLTIFTLQTAKVVWKRYSVL